MDIIKYLVAALPSAIFIILGICIKVFKMYWLISGFNTMSAEKKKNVDVKGLGNMMGNFCFIMAGIIFAFIVSLFFENVVLSIIIIVTFVFTIIYMIIRSQKFDGNAMNKDGTLNTKTKIIIGSVISFLVLILFLVGILLYQSNKPTTYNISEDKIEITGLYGETINFKDITDIFMMDKMPDITLRTNGSALGSVLKGNFLVDQIGQVKLFVNTKIPPFILIKTANQTIILNGEDQTKTQEIYTKLKQKRLTLAK